MVIDEALVRALSAVAMDTVAIDTVAMNTVAIDTVAMHLFSLFCSHALERKSYCRRPRRVTWLA